MVDRSGASGFWLSAGGVQLGSIGVEDPTGGLIPGVVWLATGLDVAVGMAVGPAAGAEAQAARAIMAAIKHRASAWLP